MEIFVEGFFPNIRFLNPDGTISSDAIHCWRKMEVESVTRNFQTGKETYNLRSNGTSVSAEKAMFEVPKDSMHVSSLQCWFLQKDLSRQKVFDSSWSGDQLETARCILDVPDWADVAKHFQGDYEVLPRIVEQYGGPRFSI